MAGEPATALHRRIYLEGLGVGCGRQGVTGLAHHLLAVPPQSLPPQARKILHLAAATVKQLLPAGARYTVAVAVVALKAAWVNL